MNWQPIESAPKDRRILLCYSQISGIKIIFGKWYSDQYAKYPKPYWCHDMGRCWGVVSMRATIPTHWSEIPDLPIGE